MKSLLIKELFHVPVKGILIFLNNVFIFLLLFHGLEAYSEIKKEVIRFSSETAQIKKKNRVLHLSGEVKISYGEYVILSDVLIAKLDGVDSKEIKIVEASKNIYFSNNKDISAKGDKLFMDVEKKFVSISGNVEFSQGSSIIKAEKIKVDLVTETVDFEGIKDSFIKN